MIKLRYYKNQPTKLIELYKIIYSIVADYLSFVGILMNFKKIFLAFSLLCASVFGYSNSYAQHGEHNHNHHDHAQQIIDEANIVMEEPYLLTMNLPFDVVYGDEDAPITMVEYASLTCGHCAKFHNDVLLELKRKYIFDGKLKVVFRHFPLNLAALRASMYVECVEEKDKKQKLLNVLFKSMPEWSVAKNDDEFKEKVHRLGKIAGLDLEKKSRCAFNKEKEQKLLEQRLRAANGLSINSTPTVFINGVRYTGKKTLEDISEVLDEMLQENNG